MPRIESIGTAVPPFKISQDRIREKAKRLFSGGFDDLNRLLTVFDNVQIRQRYFCVPEEWFDRAHDFRERNETYIFWAERLSREAISACLDKAGLSPADIDHIVFVSTSGMATPSIDARLINTLGFDRHVRRTPIFGLGCAGGAAGLSRCFDLARGEPNSRTLLVAVEISSVTFQPDDRSKSNLVASALFSDGAAAAVVAGSQLEGSGPKIVSTQSTLWPNTLGIMGWDFTETGLRVIFSRSIPGLLKRHIRQNVARFLSAHGFSIQNLSHYMIHPGGAKVIGSFQESLGLSPSDLSHSREVLEGYGNMSSPTMLFIVERVLRSNRPQRGDLGLCAAFGPGFSSELLLLNWT